MRYVRVDTQSNPHSNTFPSTEKQKDLSNILAAELKEMGFADAYADEYGYVYATIPSNSEKAVPIICFCSHIDTVSDCSGTNVKPILHKHYNGEDIVLPDDVSQIISANSYPYLLEKKGGDIITASGLTLLGADDKAGVSVIMDLANYLSKNPGVKHGTIKILFTPDEEIGKGTAKVDLNKVEAEYAYTLDGGEAGTFEDETFSANAAKITVNGISAHPGYAKNTMVNALKICGEILAALPKNEFCPEATSEREGFVHPIHMEGIAEKATIEFIVRDFVTENLALHEERLKKIASAVLKNYEGCSFEFESWEQYRNMKEVIDRNPEVADNAMLAYEMAGLKMEKKSIRGGTDGSRLSFMGLPCPNIFTGMQAIHSKHEWIAVDDMQKAVEVLINLVAIWEEKAK